MIRKYGLIGLIGTAVCWAGVKMLQSTSQKIFEEITRPERRKANEKQLLENLKKEKRRLRRRLSRAKKFQNEDDNASQMSSTDTASKEGVGIPLKRQRTRASLHFLSEEENSARQEQGPQVSFHII